MDRQFHSAMLRCYHCIYMMAALVRYYKFHSWIAMIIDYKRWTNKWRDLVTLECTRNMPCNVMSNEPLMQSHNNSWILPESNSFLQQLSVVELLIWLSSQKRTYNCQHNDKIIKITLFHELRNYNFQKSAQLLQYWGKHKNWYNKLEDKLLA